MDLLKDQSDYEEWVKARITEGDEAETPAEFPCYVYEIVHHWSLQYIKAVYLYKEDLEKMLSDLE